MNAAASIIGVVIVAVILDIYIVFFHKKFRAYLQQRKQAAGGNPDPGQRTRIWLLSARAFLAELWRYLWLDERRAAKTMIAASAILGSISIGAVYADTIGIPVFPIVLWLIEIGLCCLMLYPTVKAGRKFRIGPVWSKLLLLLAAAFLLRFAGLSVLPPGFHTDEHGTAQFVQRQVLNPLNNGHTVNPFIIDSNNQPVFYDYLWRLSLSLFGFTVAGARMSSVIAGTLSIAALFLLVDEMAGRRTAWLAAILMTAYHYHIHWSRLALNNIWVTLLVPLTLGLFLKGWRERRAGFAIWAGLSLGFTAYFYAGGYFVLFLLPILFWQAWKKSEDHIGLSMFTGKMLAVALAVAAPHMVFAMRNPDRFLLRVRDILAWNPGYAQTLPDSSASLWGFLGYQFSRSFGAYNFYPDITGFYRPEIPFLIGFASALFLWGSVWALYKKQFFPLVWLALVTILGGVMSAGTPGSSHFIGVIPAICWLIAIPLDWLMENGRSRWAYILLIVILATDLVFYFMAYRSSPSPDLILKFPLVEPYLH